MFKRLAILGIAGLVFVLGANYLLVYTLKQQVTRERERQDQNYWALTMLSCSSVNILTVRPSRGPKPRWTRLREKV